METHELSHLLQQHQQSGNLWLEFMRHDSLSMGLYVLPVGVPDPQSPHTEDEVYYIVSGRGQIFVNGEDRAVKSGDIIFVAKHIEHRFHSIEEELRILVFFAPAEGSRKA